MALSGVYAAHVARALPVSCWLLLAIPACSQDFDPVDAEVGGPAPPGLGGAASAGSECVEASNGPSTYRACISLEKHDEARASCETWGGTLVILDSAAEEAQVTQLAYDHGVANFWIGAGDAQAEGVWKWDDGRTFWEQGNIPAGVYVNWGADQPSGGPMGEENCAYMYRRTAWNDVDCAVERPFVCEKR
jgi:hypothetical protein